jgi:hypothetical protein
MTRMYRRKTKTTQTIFHHQSSDKTLSKGQWVSILLESPKDQLIHIRIVSLAGQAFLSSWRELAKGGNSIALDISKLAKGPYRMIIDFPEEYSHEDFFTIH